MHDLISARLSAGDIANYVMSTPDRVTDWVAYWVFENGAAGPPSTAALVAALDERQRYLTALLRRVADVPGGIGNPYWVTDNTPLRKRLTVHEETADLGTALAAIAATFGKPLDLHETPVRLTAYTDVRDARTRTSKTVIFAQVSHALLIGAQITGISQALFAPDPVPLEIHGAGVPTARPRPVAVTALGAARLPIEIARWLGVQARINLAARRPAQPPEMRIAPRTSTVFNSPRAGTDLTVRIVRPDLTAAQGRGVTLTALGLTAVSLALQRYLRRIGASCPDDLAAMVPVAVEDESLGVNQLTAVQADLCPAVVDPGERARAVQAGLQAARAAMSRTAPPGHKAGAVTPFVVLRPLLWASSKYEVTTTYWATTMTSVRTGSKPEWSVVGRPHAFGGTLANIASEVGLCHSFASGHSGITVTLMASRAAVADIDTYADLLEAAFVDVVAAMREPATATANRGPVEQRA